MATYHPRALLPDDQPAAWSAPVPITYDRRDVLLYAVGIGCSDLRFTFEGHPGFAVFPTFAIRWGGAGIVLDANALPPSPAPFIIDAERSLEMLAPLPLTGTVQVRSRLLAVHPRGKGSAFLEFESEVTDATGQACVRMVSGSRIGNSNAIFLAHDRPGKACKASDFAGCFLLELAATCRASTLPPGRVFHGGSLRVNPDVWAALAPPQNPGRSRSPQLVSPGCLIDGC